MEVRMVYVDSDKAPVSGNALYCVMDDVEETRKRSITLLHPITLSKFEIPVEDFRSGCEHSGIKGMVWPINNTGCKFDPIHMAGNIEETAKIFAQRGRQFPAEVVRIAIARLRGVEVTEVARLKEASEVKRGFAVKTAKRPGVVDAIANMLHEGHSINEMVKELKRLFPDRNENGMKTTVRCQINRLPAKVGMKVSRIQDKKRGDIFKFVTEKELKSKAAAPAKKGKK